MESHSFFIHSFIHSFTRVSGCCVRYALVPLTRFFSANHYLIPNPKTPEMHTRKKSYKASFCFSFSFSSPNTLRDISSTISNPSRPRCAFSPNRSTVNNSIRSRIRAQPPHRAVMRASCSKRVHDFGSSGEGLYTTVSCTESNSDQVRF